MVIFHEHQYRSSYGPCEIRKPRNYYYYYFSFLWVIVKMSFINCQGRHVTDTFLLWIYKVSKLPTIIITHEEKKEQTLRTSFSYFITVAILMDIFTEET